MASHDFNRRILTETAHRPWPMPGRPWVMTQTWHDLLFAHWPIAPGIMSARIPRGLQLDLHDGTAWLGIVPFHMTNVAPRGVPSLPGISEFPELNVRTYVRAEGKPGVFFFSLDAGSTLAVMTARLLLNLPYYSAAMEVATRSETIEYRSRRSNRPHAELIASYRSVGVPSPPAPGSLEYFLTERYCLYARHYLGPLYRLDIHHPPWPLQHAEATFARNTMADAAGIRLPDTAPLLHFSKRQDMVGWGPERIQGDSG